MTTPALDGAFDTIKKLTDKLNSYNFRNKTSVINNIYDIPKNIITDVPTPEELPEENIGWDEYGNPFMK